jgi:hypothetical protein
MRKEGLNSESNLPRKVTASSIKYILAIDLGTSGPKTALVSTQGEVDAYEFESVDLLILGQFTFLKNRVDHGSTASQVRYATANL